MLEFNVMQTPFSFGMNDGVDPKKVPFGSLTVCKDLVWLKDGRLQKRQGIAATSTSIVGGGNVAAAQRLMTRGDELALFDGTTLYSLIAAGWKSRGSYPELGMTWRTSRDDTAGVLASDAAVLSDGSIVQAWTTGDPTYTTYISSATVQPGLYYQVTDANGVITTPPKLLDSFAKASVRIVVSGTTFIIVYLTSFTNGRLRCWNNGTLTTLKTDAVASGAAQEQRSTFDACATDASNWIVAYALDAGGIRLVRYDFSVTPAQQATATVTSETSAGIKSMSIDGSSGSTVFLGYVDTQNNLAKYVCINPSSLALTLAITTIQAMPATTALPTIALRLKSSTQATVALSYSESTAGTCYEGTLNTQQVDTSGTIGTVQSTPFLSVLSRPFLMGSREFLLVGTFVQATSFNASPGITGSETFIVECTTGSAATPHRQVGKLDLLIGGFWWPGHASNVPKPTSTKAYVVAPFIAEAASNTSGIRQGTRLANVVSGADLPLDSLRSVEVGPEAYFVGPVMSAFDSAESLPYGFSHASFVDPTKTAAAGVGGTLATGNYIYATVPERRSTVGVLHRGPGSNLLKVAVTNPQKVTVQVAAVSLVFPLYNASQYALYRTVKDGTIPQRLTLDPNFAVISGANATAPNFQYLDGTADASVPPTIPGGLGARPTMYTSGGDLDDFQPPGMVTCTLYRNRIFAIAGDQLTLWYTKNAAANPGIAPGWNGAFRIFFNEKIYGLSVLDERLIVFHKRGISYFSGDGPNNAGLNGDYGAPNRLQSDVGCLTPRGIVSTPQGVMFVSGDTTDTQIQLLDRKLNIQWIGKSVQDKLDVYTQVTSAVLVADQNQVRFTCNKADGSAGIVLCYDYEQGQWSHFEYAGGVAIADALIHQDVYTFVTPGGQVYKESATTWLDNGVFVASQIVTAEISATGPVAYQSVRNFQLDGQSLSAHGLSISIAFNGDTSYAQGPKTFPEGLTNTTATGPISACKVSIGTRRKCRTIRFKIDETAPAVLGTGQGAIWSTMAIEVGQKQGLGKIAIASQQ